ncbi:MAG: transporter substrate-binding domain-containing protein [Rhizobiaceae bacterium]
MLRGWGRFIRLVGVMLFVFGATANAQSQSETGARTLQVLTKKIEPFVSHENGKFSGFSIELWQLIAEKLELKFQFKLEPTLSDLLTNMKEGRGDVAIAAVTITAQREVDIDFSHPFFRSGLAILTANKASSISSQVMDVLRSVFLSKTFALAGMILLVILLLVSHIIWLLERKNNPQFARDYFPGIWDSFWWALVTLATVGYGDKAPTAVAGRLFAMIWMVAGYLLFVYFTASITSSVTIRELRGSINGPDDLPGHKVAVIAKSTSAAYMSRYANTVKTIHVDQIEAAYDLLSKGKIEAIVHDAPVLLFYAGQEGAGKTKIAGSVFQEEDYGIVLPNDSKLREPINRAILNLFESGEYAALYAKWFGTRQ